MGEGGRGVAGAESGVWDRVVVGRDGESQAKCVIFPTAFYS